MARFHDLAPQLAREDRRLINRAFQDLVHAHYLHVLRTDLDSFTDSSCRPHIVIASLLVMFRDENRIISPAQEVNYIEWQSLGQYTIQQRYWYEDWIPISA